MMVADLFDTSQQKTGFLPQAAYSGPEHLLSTSQPFKAKQLVLAWIINIFIDKSSWLQIFTKIAKIFYMRKPQFPTGAMAMNEDEGES